MNVNTLTDDEITVMKKAVKKLTNRQIGKEMKIPRKIVGRLVKSAARKMKVQSRTRAVEAWLNENK